MIPLNDYDQFKKTLGENMKKARKSRKMVQSDVAEIMNCKDTQVSGWESGKRVPDLITFLKYCEAVGGNPNKILGCVGSAEDEADELNQLFPSLLDIANLLERLQCSLEVGQIQYGDFNGVPVTQDVLRATFMQTELVRFFKVYQKINELLDDEGYSFTEFELQPVIDREMDVLRSKAARWREPGKKKHIRCYIVPTGPGESAK